LAGTKDLPEWLKRFPELIERHASLVSAPEYVSKLFRARSKLRWGQQSTTFVDFSQLPLEFELLPVRRDGLRSRSRMKGVDGNRELCD
jgi:hypothetical protein